MTIKTKMMIKPIPLILTVIISVTIINSCHGRAVKENTELVTDGVSDDSENGSRIELIKLGENKEKSQTTNCEPLYGFLPCTTNIYGHLFMIIVYQYLLAQGQIYVGSATYRLVQIHGPDSILGGNLFQLLLTIPQTILVLASGLSESKEVAEENAVMGMQLLAGSAVMMLTLIWGACLAFGSYRFSQASSNSNFYSWITEYGVIGDLKCRWLARIMLISMIPLVIIELTKMTKSPSASRFMILVALIVTVSLFILQFTYQVMEPWILKRRFKDFLQQHARIKFIKACNVNGVRPEKEAIKYTFGMADKNHDKMLTRDELRDFLRGMRLEEHDGLLGIDDFVDKFMRELDANPDQQISEDEFDSAISKIIRNDMRAEYEQEYDINKMKSNLSVTKLTIEYVKACSELIIGSAFLIVLSTPYLMAVMNFSAAANISTMWILYVVLPVAMNFKMALAFIEMARQQNLMLTKVYEIVCLVNLVSLITFLGLVYGRDLSLDVSAEVLVVSIFGIIMGSIANFCQKFPIWISFVAISLYPISLLLLYVFKISFGWS